MFTTSLKTLQACTAPGKICEWPDFIGMINELVNFGIYLAVVFATLTFAYAGFKMLTAGDNSGEISTAKGMMGNAILGIVWVLVGWLVVQFILTNLGLQEGYSLLINK
ncbi:MAG: hypothetical protein V4664_00550 [Patescibacteria group bacterium]